MTDSIEMFELLEELIEQNENIFKKLEEVHNNYRRLLKKYILLKLEVEKPICPDAQDYNMPEHYDDAIAEYEEEARIYNKLKEAVDKL